GSTIDFIFKATCARLILIIKTQHDIDHRHAVFDGDALERVGNGAAQVLRMVGFALQNHSAGDDGVGLILNCKFPYDDGNLERTRDALERNRRVWCQCTQLSRRVINKAIYVLRIELTRNDAEHTLGSASSWTRRRSLRHLKMTNDE